jgi:hypothetical protein
LDLSLTPPLELFRVPEEMSSEKDFMATGMVQGWESRFLDPG